MMGGCKDGVRLTLIIIVGSLSAMDEQARVHTHKQDIHLHTHRPSAQMKKASRNSTLIKQCREEGEKWPSHMIMDKEEEEEKLSHTV